MSLVLPNLYDKPFAQIAEEARALIPGIAPEWTDHNVHDPGITFIELFAWLAEIQDYRLNRTSASSYARFFKLMGIEPIGPQAAEVTVTFEFSVLDQGVLLAANSKLWPVDNTAIVFETLRDLYFTRAKLINVVTHVGQREIVQTNAQENDVGHFEAFGLSPEIGDHLDLRFDGWFTEPQGQLTINLFEDDLPARNPFPPGALVLQPSATVQWRYLTSSGWADLDVIEDQTLSLSRSGDLIFRKPDGTDAEIHRQLSAVLTAGHYEIPPRIISIQTNTIRARQVETVTNEDCGSGLGTADQTVRLKKAPLFVNTEVDDGPFRVGEVISWDALLYRLQKPAALYQSPLRETVAYVATILKQIAGSLPESEKPLSDEQKYQLAQSFNTLLNQPDFYKREQFVGIAVPQEFLEKQNACQTESFVRRFNRFLLQRIFPDLLISDRLEIQTGMPAEQERDEPLTWHLWQRVEDFLKSGPDDLHYLLDVDTGTIYFGNGLNGRVPEVSELVRARFYRYSKLEQGNLTANHQWVVAATLPPKTQFNAQANLAPATGGQQKETLTETTLRTRKAFRTESAVLTGSDYQELALRTPGLRVARVKVRPNFNPELPTLNLPGEVTLIVVPQPAPRKAFPQAPPPEPSQGFLQTVLRHIEGRRLITTNIHVIGPRYVPIEVKGKVFLRKRSSETEARVSIKNALTEFFDPIAGGPEKGLGWPFGRSIFPSEVSQQLAKLPSVDYVTEVSLNGLKPGEPLKLTYDALPTSGKSSLQLVAFEARSQVIDPRKGGDGCG